MSGAGDSVPLFAPEELAAMATEVAADQRELDEWVKWLQTPAAKAEAAMLAREMLAQWDPFVAECTAGEVSHHKKAGPLPDRRAVLGYRGLRILRWIERQGAVFYPGKLERETAKRYLRDMTVVFPELVEKLSAVYLYQQSEQTTEHLRKSDGILWRDVTLDGFGILRAVGISLGAIERGKEYTQFVFLHELTHIDGGGEYSPAFHRQLDRLIKQFNRRTGGHLVNDYCE